MPDIPRDIDLQRRQLMLAGTALAGAAFLPLSACGRTEPPAPIASVVMITGRARLWHASISASWRVMPFSSAITA